MACHTDWYLIRSQSRSSVRSFTGEGSAVLILAAGAFSVMNSGWAAGDRHRLASLSLPARATLQGCVRSAPVAATSFRAPPTLYMPPRPIKAVVVLLSLAALVQRLEACRHAGSPLLRWKLQHAQSRGCAGLASQCQLRVTGRFQTHLRTRKSFVLDRHAFRACADCGDILVHVRLTLASVR